MYPVHDGQCALCKYFGNSHADEQQLKQMRQQHQAPAALIEDCEHPRLAPLNLKVTPISGCAGFEPAPSA